MFSFIQFFSHKREIRESKDEMLLGEIVRAMSRSGHPSIAFRAGTDQQQVRFKTPRDPVLHTIFVRLDRKTGTGALSSAVLGSKATLTVTAEVRNRMADPDDLIAMYKTDLANLFKLPTTGNVRLNHEMNSVLATTWEIIEIDRYVMRGDEGNERLQTLLQTMIDKCRAALRPHKKGLAEAP